MPGLFGIFGDIDKKQAGCILADMAHAVKHETWYREELHTEHGYALGRVSLGLIPDKCQPIWSEDRTVCIMLEGEIYQDVEQKDRVMMTEHPYSSTTAAEYILHLYEELGEAFAVQLNGSFAAAIWDGKSRKLILATDRMGSHPLYYSHHKQRLLFAPNVHGLLADPELPRTVDRAAIAQALTFDHILGDRSWLTAIQLMPPASLLIYQDNRLEVRTYWRLRYADNYSVRSESAYVEGFVHCLREALKRQNGNTLAQGVFLSGGLDSRVLAAVMGEDGMGEKLATFTWGIPGCDDARFAAEVATQLHTQHHFVELKPDYLLELVNKGVRLTNGSNCVHYHALAAVNQATKFVKVIYKGVMGDAMMGTALTRHFWADYNDDTITKAHFQAHYDRGLLLFTPKEHEALFTQGFLAEVNGVVMDTYREGMRASQTTQMADQRIYFDLRYRVPRMTWNGVELARSQAIVRTPYSDNDMIDFSTNLPPGFRLDRYLMKKALIEQYPKLAQIPVTETNLPLVACTRDILLRSQQVAAWHLNHLGLRKTPFIAKRPYAKADLWFRTTLRPWVTTTLLSPRALERGYFSPGYVHQLVDEHMAGANHAVKLGALLSLELWHQQFLD